VTSDKKEQLSPFKEEKEDNVQKIGKPHVQYYAN
jgi:hypothetical protein